MFRTNFRKEFLNQYAEAISEFRKITGSDRLSISLTASDCNGRPVEGAYSLHDKENSDLQQFWDIFDSITPTVDEKTIVDYTNWLVRQDLMISESADGFSFRSSRVGGEKFTAKDLYEKFVTDEKLYEEFDKGI